MLFDEPLSDDDDGGFQVISRPQPSITIQVSGIPGQEPKKYIPPVEKPQSPEPVEDTVFTRESTQSNLENGTDDEVNPFEINNSVENFGQARNIDDEMNEIPFEKDSRNSSASNQDKSPKDSSIFQAQPNEESIKVPSPIGRIKSQENIIEPEIHNDNDKIADSVVEEINNEIETEEKVVQPETIQNDEPISPIVENNINIIPNIEKSQQLEEEKVTEHVDETNNKEPEQSMYSLQVDISKEEKEIELAQNEQQQKDQINKLNQADPPNSENKVVIIDNKEDTPQESNVEVCTEVEDVEEIIDEEENIKEDKNINSKIEPEPLPELEPKPVEKSEQINDKKEEIHESDLSSPMALPKYNVPPPFETDAKDENVGTDSSFKKANLLLIKQYNMKMPSLSDTIKKPEEEAKETAEGPKEETIVQENNIIPNVDIPVANEIKKEEEIKVEFPVYTTRIELVPSEPVATEVIRKSRPPTAEERIQQIEQVIRDNNKKVKKKRRKAKSKIDSAPREIESQPQVAKKKPKRKKKRHSKSTMALKTPDISREAYEYIKLQKIAKERYDKHKNALKEIKAKEAEANKRLNEIQYMRMQKAYEAQMREKQKAEIIAQHRRELMNSRNQQINKTLERLDEASQRKNEILEKKKLELAAKRKELQKKHKLAEQNARMNDRMRQEVALQAFKREQEREQQLEAKRIEDMKRREQKRLAFLAMKEINKFNPSY